MREEDKKALNIFGAIYCPLTLLVVLYPRWISAMIATICMGISVVVLGLWKARSDRYLPQLRRTAIIGLAMAFIYGTIIMAIRIYDKAAQVGWFSSWQAGL